MSKLSNTLIMLKLLSSKRKYTIKELAEILEVTPRMIRNYKDDLEKSGIYIDSIKGPYGGYVLNQSIKLPQRKFNYEDYELLSNLEVSDNDKEKLKVLADKVRGVYIESKNEEAELSENTKDYYNLLVRAIKEKRKCKINYYSYVHGNQDRVIHPLNMFLYENGWGCAAYCELKSDLRNFELKRINKIEILNENFK